jgi:hypothetical protein
MQKRVFKLCASVRSLESEAAKIYLALWEHMIEKAYRGFRHVTVL